MTAPLSVVDRRVRRESQELRIMTSNFEVAIGEACRLRAGITELIGEAEKRANGILDATAYSDFMYYVQRLRELLTDHDMPG